MIGCEGSCWSGAQVVWEGGDSGSMVVGFGMVSGSGELAILEKEVLGCC